MSEDAPTAPAEVATPAAPGSIPRRPAMVLVDVDGTMVDSVPDLAWSVDRMMEHLGHPTHGEAAVRNWVGNGVERLVKRALTGALDGEPDPALFDRALPVFLEVYQENTSKRSRLYPGVREGLELLKARGYPLGCVTNKAGRFTEPLLELTGLRRFFGVVVSGDTVERKKPHADPMLFAARTLGATPCETLMVGDSLNDVQSARAAGCPVVVVPYGYREGLSLDDLGADAVVASVEEAVRSITMAS